MEDKISKKMSSRKVIGLSKSAVISLPPSWLEAQNIKVGDTVRILVGATAILVSKDLTGVKR